MITELKCERCGYMNDIKSLDTTNTKEVYQGSDMSWGYFDVYSIFGLCKRCNQHSVLLKVTKKESNMIKEMYESKEVQDMIKRLSKK